MLRQNEIELKDLTISDIIPRKNLDEYESEILKLKNKTALITGAGGSIGSEICKILINADLKKMILVDISEYALFSISEELKEINNKTNLEIVLLDIKDKNKCDNLIKKFSPEYVYHAAAYKHVPILEDQNNWTTPFENNFFGSCNIANACVDNGVERFIFVSTDKAVRPTSLMGASKRLAELYVQSLNEISKDTFLTSVRFGNVIDSSGSVIPTFRKQIKNGGPITVTHPEIIRYFMSIGEAAYLVIVSSIIAEEPGVYMLKMGDPVKIIDIAKRMIRLSGNKIKDEHNDDGIEILFTGLRPGEKLYEELLVNDEDSSTKHPKIFIDTSSRIIEGVEFNTISQKLKEIINAKSLNELKVLLKDYADYKQL